MSLSIDSDDDVDVLGAAVLADDITWWENDGSENFTEHIIASNFAYANCVFAIDLDSDGDVDVLGTASNADEITWWENDGSQNFTEHTIAGNFDGARSVYASDLDGDSDIDVLGAAMFADEITWWENDGSQNFTVHTIDSSFDGARDCYAEDIDSDGDMDVLGAAHEADEITWWENDGNQPPSFTEHTIDSTFDGANSIFAIDLDGDDDIDVLGAANLAGSTTWWENDGSQNFIEHIIDGDFVNALDIYATDLDGDSDMDVLGASTVADEIAWWENDGNQNFTKHIIAGNFDGAYCIFATDIDSDNDVDVLGAAHDADKITWWENVLDPIPQITFSEDWESGIDPTVWNSYGSPLPVTYTGEGRNNSVGFDANGDPSYGSGAVSWQNFDLMERPILEFWSKGHSSYLTWQAQTVGWSETTAANYSGTGAQPSPIIYIEIAPETQYDWIKYIVLGEVFEEPWDFQDQWLYCQIVINTDSTVSFYRSEPPNNELVLIYTSTTSIELSNYREQALVLDGRSYDTHQILDDIAVNSAAFNTLSGSISGIITSGDYLIAGDIYIQSGDSLIIEPGVTFLFQGNYSFDIDGYIFAVGNEIDSIKFLPDIGTDSWGGIDFNDSSDDNNELGYCVVTGSNSSGIYCGYANPLITKSRISGNSSSTWGGGINCSYSNPSISNCTVSGNSASIHGGGIFTNYCNNPSISNSLISGNSASTHGGGIHFNNTLGNPSVENCTIVGNSASENGGGIWLSDTNPVIVNTIVEGNTGNGGVFFWVGFVNPSITYCDFNNNENGNFVGESIPPDLGIITTTNANGDSCDVFSNIFLDPVFVDAMNGDFHLMPNSPCIDGGDPTSPLDPDNTVADIGAYYFDQPCITIELTLYNPPIIIPENGGFFNFNISIVNNNPDPQTTDIWTYILLPVVGELEIINVLDFPLTAGQIVSRDRIQEVPEFAPAGTYTYYACVGDYPWVVDYYDSFTFIKEGTDGGGWLGTHSDWLCNGDPFPGELIENSPIPASFIFYPPAPNPFNPKASLSYNLPSSSEISLVVYNIGGREVARLIDGYQSAGFHNIDFNAEHLTSGVYFARLSAGNHNQIQKLLLVK